MNSRCIRLHGRLAAAVFTLMVLAGCSVLPKAESLQVYSLPDASMHETVPAEASTQHSWVLKMQTPYSSGVLNSNRIVVRPDNSELSTYKGARWNDRAPVMLRDRLVDTLRTRLQVLTFGHDSVNVVPDLELGSDLNRFQVEYQKGAPIVQIQLDAFLVNPRTSQVVASRRFSVQQPVDGTAVPEVVSAFGLATDKLAAELVVWVQQHGPTQRPSS